MPAVYSKGFDAHTHLDDVVFDQDREQVLRRAKRAGVLGACLAAGDPARLPVLVALADRWGLAWCGGTHPWWVGEHTSLDVVQERLERYDPPIVGEIGLDRRRDAWEVQRAAFDRQLRWAAERERPVVLHAVRAVDDVLAAVARTPPPRAMIHAFSGSVQQVERAMSLGVFLSVGTSSVGARDRAAEAIAAIHPDRLLLETDCPHRPIPGTSRGEPAHLTAVCEAVAAVRGEDPAELFARAGESARRFFAASLPAAKSVESPHGVS